MHFPNFPSSTFSADLSAAALRQRCTAVGALSCWRASGPGAPRTVATSCRANNPQRCVARLLGTPRARHACVELRGAAIVKLGQAQSAEHLGAGSERAPAAPSRDTRGRSAPAAGARRGSGTAANGTAGRSAATVRTRRRGQVRGCRKGPVVRRGRLLVRSTP